MGKAGIQGKQPMEVAIAIAAQVMHLYQSLATEGEVKLDKYVHTMEIEEHV